MGVVNVGGASATDWFEIETRFRHNQQENKNIYKELPFSYKITASS